MRDVVIGGIVVHHRDIEQTPRMRCSSEPGNPKRQVTCQPPIPSIKPLQAIRTMVT